MAWIDTAAMWIGYVIMASMGMGMVAFSVCLALEQVLKRVMEGV